MMTSMGYAKILQTDNGAEFTNCHLKKFLEDKGKSNNDPLFILNHKDR